MIVYRVQVGSYESEANAKKKLEALKKAGFEGEIVKAEVADNVIKPKDPTGAEKVHAIMEPYIDSKTAHADFVAEYNKMMEKVGHSKISLKNAWCTMFIDLCFWKAGYLDLIGYGKRSKELMENAKKKGTWKSGTSDIKYGDVVIFQNSKGEPNHSEFALGYKDKKLRLISGNYSGGVHIRSRSGLSTVKGRIRPRYPQ